jgi:hypothetical protein
MIWVAKGRKVPDETQKGSWLSSNWKLHYQQISGGFQVMRQGFYIALIMARVEKHKTE